ncbi:MAG: DMT family transporter [Gemmataceae bacterium]
MSSLSLVLLTSLAMIAFAGNSLLCRFALKQTAIDPATFTTLRLASGAIILWFLVQVKGAKESGHGTWLSTLALWGYATGFSFAYVSLPAATGALLLFGAVQATMIGFGIWSGERLGGIQIVGFLVALSGLVGLLLPGLAPPPVAGSILMLTAGVSWGLYSLRGRGVGDPTKVTAGNFLLTVPIAVLVTPLMVRQPNLDLVGIAYATASGGLASGIGYAIWYTALPSLRATTAATVQLSVPVLTAVGAFVLLGEPITLRVILASVAILGGIALVILNKRNPDPRPKTAPFVTEINSG